MAQEEQTPMCSNSSSGGGGGISNRSSRKLKNKKVPQRGLGVAQLEKIRLEEQQKKDVATCVLSPNSIISPSNSSSCLAIQSPNFRSPPPTALSPATIPLPPPLPINFQSLIPNTDVSKPMNVAGGGGNWPKLWNGEYNFEAENHNGFDHRGFAATFPANVGLPYESNTPIWPLPNTIQRSQQFQQPCSSSMVNVSAGTSSSSSSVLNFQMEPPSNQSYCGNNYTPLWPEEEKMVGMKRPYPFSLESVPIPSFHCKFPSTYVSLFSKSDESASCSNGGTTNIESANSVFRKGPLNSSTISKPNPKKVIDENGVLTRDFLSLAPPQAAQSHLNSKQKLHPSPYINPHSGELPQFEGLPHQGHNKDPFHLHGRGVSNQHQQTFLSLFPTAKTHMGQAGNSNCEARESVDLNLKL